jgi:hypothetical protein
MNLGAAICLLTLVVSIVRDLFIPATREMEVWLGFEITGPLALVTAPIHWAIFAAGAWGFWTTRPWIAKVAAGYLVYAGVAHLVWSEASVHGRGWPIGLVQALLLTAVAVGLLRADARDVGRWKANRLSSPGD